MNVKRFVLGFVAVFVASQVLGFVIHQVLLGATYASLADVWRPEAEMMAKMWMMWITGGLWTVLFCYIFTRGYEDKGIMEGLRFGLLIGLFWIPFAYESHVIYPVPIGLAHNSTRRNTMTWSPRARLGGIAHGLVFWRMNWFPAFSTHRPHCPGSYQRELRIERYGLRF